MVTINPLYRPSGVVTKVWVKLTPPPQNIEGPAPPRAERVNTAVYRKIEGKEAGSDYMDYNDYTEAGVDRMFYYIPMPSHFVKIT